MKKGILAIVLFTAISAFTTTDIWKHDIPHSQLSFTVIHMGINNITGAFNDFNITIQSEKQDFSDAKVALEAKVASIDTKVKQRDDHLRSADFFDVEKYENITFKSTDLKKVGKDVYKLSGDLTMHGVTKSITMDWIFKGRTIDPMSDQEVIAFELNGVLKRSDFKIGEEFPDALISDLVRIKYDGEFKK